MWDGRYFVTIGLPAGRVVRRDAAERLPERATVLACDNGLQDKAYYRDLLASLRSAWRKASVKKIP